MTGYPCWAAWLHWLSLCVFLVSSGFWIYACFAKVEASSPQTVKPFDRRFETDDDFVGADTGKVDPDGKPVMRYYNASYQKQSFFNSIAGFLTAIGLILQVISELIIK